MTSPHFNARAREGREPEPSHPGPEISRDLFFGLAARTAPRGRIVPTHAFQAPRETATHAVVLAGKRFLDALDMHARMLWRTRRLRVQMVRTALATRALHLERRYVRRWAEHWNRHEAARLVKVMDAHG